MEQIPELMSRLQAALGPQYHLEREIGRGGMGVIFRAVDTALDRPVAVGHRTGRAGHGRGRSP